jgi:MSHA biogenesis protein MshE
MAEKRPNPQKKLGDILVDCRVVTQAQVNAALAHQRRTGKLFGESLLDLGFVSEEDLGWALSAQLNVPYVDLTSDMVDRSAVQIMGAELMRGHKALPLVRVGDALTVVLADPTSREAISEIEQATGLTTQISIASPRRIMCILDEILGPENRKLEESGDLLFREITRPTVGEGSSGGPLMNKIGQILSVALRQKIREVHFEPEAGMARVRFRIGSTLEDQPPIKKSDLEAMVHRLRQAMPPAAHPPGCWRSSVQFASGVLELTVSLLPGVSGEALIVELSEVRSESISLEQLGMRPEEARRLRNVLSANSGLVVVTGSNDSSTRAVLSVL